MNIDTRAMVAAMFDGEPINPRDFIRPDGSYDVTPENLGSELVPHIDAHLPYNPIRQSDEE